MYTEIFDKTASQMQQFVEPLQQAQSKLVEHASRMADVQVAAFKQYSDLGMDTMQALTAIQDAQSLQAYVTKQTEVAKGVGERLTTDVNEFIKINRGLAEDMQKLAREHVPGTATEGSKKSSSRKSTSSQGNGTSSGDNGSTAQASTSASGSTASSGTSSSKKSS